MSGLNLRDIARRTGSNKEAIKYLQSHEIAAVIIFSLAVIISGLWFEVFRHFVKEVAFRNKKVTWKEWFVVALLASIAIFVIIKYVFKVPVTVAWAM